MHKFRVILAVSVLVAVAGFAGFIYLHSTSINENDHMAIDTFEVTLFVNIPEAGKITNETAKVKEGSNFVCTVLPAAHGYVWEGWFTGNTLVSKAKSFSYTVYADVTLEARFYLEKDVAFIITQDSIKIPMNMTLTPTIKDNVASRSWKITDEMRHEVLPHWDSGTGDGSITFAVNKGAPISLYMKTVYTNGTYDEDEMVIVINEEVNKHYEWRYQEDNAFSSIFEVLSINDGAVTWDVKMPFTEYYEAITSDIPRYGTAAYARIPDYITTDSEVLAVMAENLRNFAWDMSDLETVEFVLKFVQSFAYVTDKDSKGQADYWKLPIETLWEQNGDCEDHAVLLATLLACLDYKVVLFHVYVYENGKMVGGHVAVGVAVAGVSGYSEMYNGLEYFYCEATSEVGTSILNQANVGYKPDGFEVVEIWSITQSP